MADSQNAKYEYAQSLLVRARLAHQLGLPEAQEQIQQAEEALESIEGSIEVALVQALSVEKSKTYVPILHRRTE